MKPSKKKSDAIYVRVTPETKQAFNEEAAKFEPLSPSDVLRELVIGFIEGRVTIIPPHDKKESIYVPRIEN
jgi:hypothetical protein